MGHDHHHAATFAGLSHEYRRRLTWVTAINLAMFAVEMTAGALSGSQALKADALDFAADGFTYALSLWAIGKATRVRTGAAVVKGLSLLILGLWVAGTTLYQLLVLGVPSPEVMSAVGLLALGANVASVLLLMDYRHGDANVRSVWLCSRNDAIGNVAVVMAAVAVALLHSGVPDLIVAGAMAVLFLHSAYLVLRQSWTEWRHSSLN